MRISDWSSDVCSSDLVAQAEDLRIYELALFIGVAPTDRQRHLFGEVIVELAEQRKGARVHTRGDRLQRAGGLQVGSVPERDLLAELMIAVVERSHHPVEHIGRPVR